jgi:hypothetical protein
MNPYSSAQEGLSIPMPLHLFLPLLSWVKKIPYPAMNEEEKSIRDHPV